MAVLLVSALTLEDESKLFDGRPGRTDRRTMTLPVDVVRADDVPLELVGEVARADRSEHRQRSGWRDCRHVAFARRGRAKQVLCAVRRPDRAEADQVGECGIEPGRVEDEIPRRVHAL